METISITRRRRSALVNLGKMSNKRRALLARFIDHAVLSNRRDDGTFYGMSREDTLAVHETLMDVRQVCEIKGELDEPATQC